MNYIQIVLFTAAVLPLCTYIPNAEARNIGFTKPKEIGRISAFPSSREEYATWKTKCIQNCKKTLPFPFSRDHNTINKSTSVGYGRVGGQVAVRCQCPFKR